MNRSQEISRQCIYLEKINSVVLSQKRSFAQMHILRPTRLHVAFVLISFRLTGIIKSGDRFINPLSIRTVKGYV